MTTPKLEWKRVDEDPELHVLEVGGATATAHVRGSGAVWGASYGTGRNQTNASGRDLTLAAVCGGDDMHVIGKTALMAENARLLAENAMLRADNAEMRTTIKNTFALVTPVSIHRIEHAEDGPKPSVLVLSRKQGETAEDPK